MIKKVLLRCFISYMSQALFIGSQRGEGSRGLFPFKASFWDTYQLYIQKNEVVGFCFVPVTNSTTRTLSEIYTWHIWVLGPLFGIFNTVYKLIEKHPEQIYILYKKSINKVIVLP